MYLSRFGVKNYKCLTDVEIPLTPLHVIIGPNDAGKTSLLEAMAALHQSAYVDHIRQAFPQPWTGRELVFDGANSDTVELSGFWENDPDHTDSKAGSIGYGLAVRFPADGNGCQLVDEWALIEQKNLRLFSQSYTTMVSQFRRGEVPSDPSKRDVLNMLAELIRPSPIYSFNPRVMAVPAALDPSRKFRMDRDGFGLPTMLHDILTADPERFLKLRERFCELFPQFRSIRLETEQAIQRSSSGSLWRDEVREAGQGLRFETKTGRTIRGQQASDGTILMLGFLALSYLPEPPRLLLIEEPENGIYPKRLQEVVTMLRRMAQEKGDSQCPQIVFTTHSPFVVSFFEPEEVTFLSRDPAHPESGVRARPLRDAPRIRERLAEGEFYLGELWYNLSEEEVFGEFAAPNSD